MLAAIGEIYMGVRNITVQIQRQPNIEPCYRLFGDVFEDKGGKYLGGFAVGKDIAFRQLDRAIFQYKGVIAANGADPFSGALYIPLRVYFASR